MQLRNVEIFCDVAARRSFSKAAQAHNVSQSLVSQTVHTLEERLGTQLIDRSKRPLELTPAGELYYDGCRKLLETYRQLEDRVREVENNKVAGRVRVAAIYSVGLLRMDAYVRRLEELYPEVSLRVEYLHPDEVYDRILADEADLGLVSFPRDGGEISCINWQEQEMVLVVPGDHRFAGRKSVRPKEIAGEDFVAFTSELTVRKQIDRWLKQEHASVTVVHEFDNIENIKRAVEVGSAVTILPEPAVEREVELGSLDRIRFKGVDWHRPIGIIHRRHKTLTTAANKFVELLHEDPATFAKPTGTRESNPHTNGNGRSRSKKQRKVGERSSS